jgi:hypothetical protein
MPGKPVGTIFAELDLDTTKFTRAQKQILAEAKTTSLNVEKNWSIIGQKSDLMYDAMRQRITNAYEMIKNRATTTAAEIVRAEEAKDRKLREINEQQFGRQTSLLESLKKNWLAVTAAVTAAYLTAQRAWRLAEEAADFEERINVLNALGSQYDLTGRQILISMQDAARGLISMKTAADMAASAMNLSLNPQQMIEFTRVSEKLTDVIGGTIPEAFNRMVVAAASGSTMTLAQMGIIVNLEEAYKQHAATLGRNVKSLSDIEKQQIRLNVILDEAIRKTSVYGEAIDTTRDKMDRLKVTVDDVRLSVGIFFTRVMVGGVGAAQVIWSAFITTAGAIMRTVQSILELSDTLKLTENAAERWRRGSEMAFKDAAELWDAAIEKFKLMVKSSEDIQKHIIVMPEITVEGERMADELTKFMEDLRNRERILMARGDEKAIEQLRIRHEAEIKQLKKYTDDKNVIRSVELFHQLEMSELLIEQESKAEEERLRLIEEARKREKALISDAIYKYQEYLGGIREGEVLMDGMIYRIDALAERNKKLEEATKKRYEAEGAFDRMWLTEEERLRQLERETEIAGEWQIAWKGAVQTIGSSFQSGFFDLFKGGIDDMGDAFNQFCDNMTQSFLRAISNMITNYMLFGNLMGTYETGAGLLGWIGRIIGAGGASAAGASAAGASAGGASAGGASAAGAAGASAVGAMGLQGGGWITEPIYGIGQSGRRYTFAERGPELVTPGSKVGGPTVIVHIENKTGLQLKNRETDMTWDGRRWVKNTILELAVTDMDIRGLLKGGH